MKVLFVDDELAVLESFKRALRKEPYEVLTASSPVFALETLAVHMVDIVVSDERMPGGSGAEFLRRVSQMYPNVLRILLTGDPGLDGAVRAIETGKLYRFLNKPISTAELAQTLRNALRVRETDALRLRLKVAGER